MARTGVVVLCVVCYRMKKPVGRSAPLAGDYCDHECAGYKLDPQVGSLWPGETDEDFGYPVSDVGAREVK